MTPANRNRRNNTDLVRAAMSDLDVTDDRRYANASLAEHGIPGQS